MQRGIWILAIVMQLHYHIAMDENELESSLTDRYQTTVPARIRKLLGLSKRDKLEWLLDESGGVRVAKKGDQSDHVDPIFDQWLSFLEKDMMEHPERLIALDEKHYEDMVFQFSGERGVGVPGLPPTLAEFLAQPLPFDIDEALDDGEGE
jgi:antitoxin PrlF